MGIQANCGAFGGTCATKLTNNGPEDNPMFPCDKGPQPTAAGIKAACDKGRAYHFTGLYLDCAAMGLKCQLDKPDAPVDSNCTLPQCEGAGTCTGTTWTLCEGDKTVAFDCAVAGLKCVGGLGCVEE